MSRQAFIIEAAGLKFKVSGELVCAGDDDVIDLEVLAIFSDDEEQVLVEVAEEFLDHLYVAVPSEHQRSEFLSLRQHFEQEFIKRAST